MMEPSRADRLATVITAACALVATAWLIFGPQQLPRERAEDTAIGLSSAEWAEVVAGGNRMGPANRDADLVIFVDYQCPWCRVLEERMDLLRKTRFADLAVIYRHFPIEQLHPHARDASLAIECAAQQERFVPFHRALFAAQDSIGHITWGTFATRAGVRNLERFDACIANPETRVRTERDEALARDLGLRGTPAILASGKRYRGTPDTAKLAEIIAEGRR